MGLCKTGSFITVCFGFYYVQMVLENPWMRGTERTDHGFLAHGLSMCTI